MPRARGRKEAPEAEEPSKAWLDSYADAMTLLLAFFVLLYASSLIDEDKFIDFKVGVAEALGQPSPVLEGGSGILDRGNGVATLVSAPPTIDESVDSSGGGGNVDTPTDADGDEILDSLTEVTPDNAEQVVEALQRKIDEVGAAEFVEIVNDARGVIIRFDSQVLFRSGEAKILPDGVLVLQSVGGALAALDNLLVVEGHTDDVPTDGTKWPSNWELSVTRATTVLRFLTDLEAIPPIRISAAGYADTRPRASNDTADGRAENRRVEIVIVVAPWAEQIVGDPSTTATGDITVDNPVGITPDPGNILDLDPAPVEPAD